MDHRYSQTLSDHYLKKKDRSVVKEYCEKMTGYSRAQVTRIIARNNPKKEVRKGEEKNDKKKEITKPNRFPKIYGTSEIARLMETDDAHGRLSGAATKRILMREYAVFGKKDFAIVQKISISHLYNLRGTRQYQSKLGTFTKTNPTPIPIGERRKPDNEGQPGYIRVDTVHQGDYLSGTEHKKGVYYINLVDEVTQWETVVCVEKISERYLLPVLERAITEFPFGIINFHSDNGSEFINSIPSWPNC